ncbi:TIGR04282 family arsenosugar biosynthesis glycosyltransferase [Aquimarina addita]|uniref:TIGR04282 family arsenosugar biosynthesis glycosyltransferase n=1 Tax=Aquimarina addita TaxID=870485 RepID=A0ABP6UVF7_9FLAO
MKATTENLLLIFTRNPELGKCKTRLAATIGDQKALDIYTFLLQHTVAITENLTVTKEVHYSVKVRDQDLWNTSIYNKKQQQGDDLGERMQHAFANGFKAGYKNIIIIGSDMYDLNQKDLENAFNTLQTSEYVIGPAEDGGYYLLGMKSLRASVFANKKWGTSTVLQDTLRDLSDAHVKLLPEKNDIDYYEDIKDIPDFQQFLT